MLQGLRYMLSFLRFLRIIVFFNIFSTNLVWGQEISQSDLVGGYDSYTNFKCVNALELKDNNKFVLTEYNGIDVYRRRFIFFKTKTDHLTRRGSWKLVGDSIYFNTSAFSCSGETVFYCKIHINEPHHAGRLKKCFDLIGKNQIFEPYCRKE